MTNSVTLRAVSKALEGKGYLKFRKVDQKDMKRWIDNLQEEIESVKGTEDREGEKVLLDRKKYVQDNIKKPWGFCLGEGMDYKQFATFEECVLSLLNEWLTEE